MVRYGVHDLFRQAVLTEFHPCREHRKGLAAADNVVQQRVLPCADDTVNRVLLVRLEFDCRIHTGKSEIGAVVCRQARLIEYRIVFLLQFFTPCWIVEDPIDERFLDLVLFLSRGNRFRLIQYPSLTAVAVLNRVVNGGCA